MKRQHCIRVTKPGTWRNLWRRQPATGLRGKTIHERHRVSTLGEELGPGVYVLALGTTFTQGDS